MHRAVVLVTVDVRLPVAVGTVRAVAELDAGAIPPILGLGAGGRLAHLYSLLLGSEGAGWQSQAELPGSMQPQLLQQ
jgi:hypothetical protein